MSDDALLLGLSVAQDLVLAAVCALAAVTDLRTRLIRDVHTVPAFLAGVGLLTAIAWVQGANPGAGLGNALLGALPGALFFGLPVAFGALGLGDAKLMAAVGALVGFPASLGALLVVTVTGGLQGVGALLLRTTRGRRLSARAGLRDVDSPTFLSHVPYGLSIAVGAAAFRLLQAWISAG